MQPFEIPKQQLIFLLSAIGLITLPHSLQIPISLFGFFALLWIWRFLGVWKKTLLPNSFLVFVLMLTGVGLLFFQYHGVVFGRDAGTGLFVVALGLKLLEIKSTRDVYLIAYLAFVVAATEFLYVQNVLMALYILAVCILLICTLITINHKYSNNTVAFKMAGKIVLQALPIMAILFVLFPRLESPRWSLLKEEHKAPSGISDTLEMDTLSKLALSYDLAFRVKFEGEIPQQNQLYWRGVVYSQTDGKKWFQSSNTHFKHFMDKPTFLGKFYSYTLMMEAQQKNWVYALEMPAQFSHPLLRNENYQLITQNNSTERTEYKITSYPSYNTGYITKTEYRDNLQLPAEPSEKITDLVKQLQGFDVSPEAFIQNVLNHFHNEKFVYTLAAPLMSENPIESFLFDAKQGFCSHYATAFVYLMRVAHIPARVIGGYQGGELNKVGNFLEIRQANAHAWTEVWLKEKGWIRIDPTAAIAPERVEQEIDVSAQVESGEVHFEPITLSDEQMNWLKTARHLWENVDYSWQRWIINYNNQNQAQFLKTFGIHNLQVMMYWLMYFMALIFALSTWFLLKKQNRTADEALVIYEKFCRKLEKNGLTRKPTEGFKDFSQRAASEMPHLSIQISEVTALFLKIRYGKHYLDKEYLKELKKIATLKGGFK